MDEEYCNLVLAISFKTACKCLNLKCAGIEIWSCLGANLQLLSYGQFNHSFIQKLEGEQKKVHNFGAL